MANQLAIYPYKQGSRSAHTLAEALNCNVLKRTNSKFRHSSDKIVINWGASEIPSWSSQIINKNISICSNKLFTFKALKGKVSIPEWTTSKEIARDWNDVVVVRHVLTGHSGNGIEIVEAGHEIPNAPLYVRYIPKNFEFRIHVMKFGDQYEVIDAQRKIRDPNQEPKNWKVRSHDNGFIFARNGLTIPDCVVQNACATLPALGIQFGAVDIVYQSKKNKAYVLEVNTAPGLEGQTVQNYAGGFKRMLNIN